MAEETMVKDSMVLCSGRPAKLAGERSLLSLMADASLLLIILVKIFLSVSNKAIGYVLAILWVQINFFGKRQRLDFFQLSDIFSSSIAWLRRSRSHFFPSVFRFFQAS